MSIGGAPDCYFGHLELILYLLSDRYKQSLVFFVVCITLYKGSKQKEVLAQGPHRYCIPRILWANKNEKIFLFISLLKELLLKTLSTNSILLK